MEKAPRYIHVTRPPKNGHPSKNKLKSLSVLTTSQLHTLHYIHVTRTCQNAHPFENFTFCKRLARGIHSRGNTLRLLACTWLYEQRRAGQRNSACGPQTSQNRHKRRFMQDIPDKSPRKIQLVIHPEYRARLQPGHCHSWVCELCRSDGSWALPFAARKGTAENRVSRATKKSRVNKGFGKTRTPAHAALVVLALESQLLLTRRLLFSCGLSVGYGLQTLTYVDEWQKSKNK